MQQPFNLLVVHRTEIVADYEQKVALLIITASIIVLQLIYGFALTFRTINTI